MSDARWADLRREYMQAGFDESHALADPLAELEKWLSQAHKAGVPEANAMTLATATREGTPSARVVLLKGLDARGLVFYTNYESHKARDLADNPRAAISFVWLELERQVRVEGDVTRVTREESAEYFSSRPRGSQLGAWASLQSAVVANRAALDSRLAEVTARFENQDVPVPDNWGGYRLIPHTFEFWQGRPNRMHDRLRYTLTQNEPSKGTWRIDRLSP